MLLEERDKAWIVLCSEDMLHCHPNAVSGQNCKIFLCPENKNLSVVISCIPFHFQWEKCICTILPNHRRTSTDATLNTCYHVILGALLKVHSIMETMTCIYASAKTMLNMWLDTSILTPYLEVRRGEIFSWWTWLLHGGKGWDWWGYRGTYW